MSEAFRLNTRNCVLMKDDVGRARPTHFDLPEEGFAYGRAEPADAEGAREVTMNWCAHVPRPKPGADTQDFSKINKLAAQSRITTAKDLAQFRNSVDVKLVHSGPQGPAPKVIPSDVIPSFAYGRKSRPSTPIAAIVGNQYAAESEELLDSSYRRFEEERAGKSVHIVRMTKKAKGSISDSRLRREEDAKALSDPPREYFKLSKFKKVTSRILLPKLSKSASAPSMHAEMSM